jgi:hypothetical protein
MSLGKVPPTLSDRMHVTDKLLGIKHPCNPTTYYSIKVFCFHKRQKHF